MDLKEVRRKIIDEGASMKELIVGEHVLNYSQLQFAEKIKKYCVTPKFCKKQVYWLYGPPECGKSKKMWEIIHDLKVDFWIYPGGGFFDGYDGQKIAVFDDFRLGDLAFNKILQITHEHPSTVNIKGTSGPWCAEYIFFTAPEPPDIIFQNTGENLVQITRRITHLLGPSEICPEVQKVIV